MSTESSAAIGSVEGVSLYDVDHPAPVIEPPRKRTGTSPKASRTNFEMYAWLFMRLSGIVLVVLVLGHLLIQVWDLLMLWLAMLHGANGLRTVINDYAERANTRLWLKGLLYTATVFTVLLGTLVIFTFDPNIR